MWFFYTLKAEPRDAGEKSLEDVKSVRTSSFLDVVCGNAP